MSGILDNKSRVIDAMLTIEGRRQMAEGTFEISYVTFSDADVVYQPDDEEGHIDPTNRIYFESSNLPQDQITFEANDEGKLLPFRVQDIKLFTANGNIPTSTAEGRIVNGRLTAYQYYHGRRVKTNSIFENPSDDGKGFVYEDSTGLTGSILIKSNLNAGSVLATSPSPGGPYVAYVGTRGGMGPQEFALLLSSAVGSLRNLGGPNVYATALNESVYLDSNESILGMKIFATGTLSSPLIIEESAIGGKLLVDEIQNSSFASQIQGILTSSFDNFLQLQTLASINRLFEDQEFYLSNNSINFDLSKVSNSLTKIFTKSPPTVNVIDSLFSDDKLSHLENFMYLPPIVKTSDSILTDKSNVDNLTDYLLGHYPSWGNNENKLTYEKLIKQLESYEDSKTPIVFTTSNKNNLIGQFFEVAGDTVNKLDVIDFGEVLNPTTNSMNHIYFVGKTFLDNRGTVCYVNMFTLIFSNISTYHEAQQ